MQKSANMYSNPLLERYSSKEMSYIFSPNFKFTTWRKLWIALAESQMELGLPITLEQVAEMKEHIDDIDYEAVHVLEAKTRHDVMAHIHAYGAQCPKAGPIIHLGATSAYVGDNTDLIQMRAASIMLLQRLTTVLSALRSFAVEYKDCATLGYTHFQSAQLTTVGKRACLWMYELTMDFTALESFVAQLPFLGVKGTTGTQASFLGLFNGDSKKVKQLDAMVTKKMGFTNLVPVSGQTYSRKIDAQAAATGASLAQLTENPSAEGVPALFGLRDGNVPGYALTRLGSLAGRQTVKTAATGPASPAEVRQQVCRQLGETARRNAVAILSHHLDKLAADAEGKLTAFQLESFGTPGHSSGVTSAGGSGGAGFPAPYIYQPAATRDYLGFSPHVFEYLDHRL